MEAAKENMESTYLTAGKAKSGIGTYKKGNRGDGGGREEREMEQEE